MSRLERSSKTIAFNFLNTGLTSLLGFVSRTVFIRILGSEYLGLAGLLNNVLGFLAISELGIAAAIGFSLYKPLAEKDYDTVSALMSLYRRAYAVIAGIVAVAGVGLFFFLDFFVPPEQQPDGTAVAYFAFLTSNVVGYLFSYKTTLINSDNQAYRIAPIVAIASIVQTTCQIVALLITRSYVVYIIIQIACGILQMVVQNRFITRHYPQVDFRSRNKLDVAVKQQIKRNIGGLVIAKIGDYLVNSTDNLIITKMVSLTATGIYSNYLMIRNLINSVIGTLFGGITASLGNVVAVETDKRKLEIFETLLFSAFFVYAFEAVCFLCLLNPFIGDIWIGEEFLFDLPTVSIIVINNFLTGLRLPLIHMRSAAGKYMEDAWVPFAFAGINLVASIILARYYGVAGVFLGTIIGSLLTADWYRPLVIYKHVFHVSVWKYFRKYALYVLLGLAYMAGAYLLCSFIATPYVILNFVIKAAIAVSVPILLSVLFFYRTSEFKYLMSMFKRLTARLRRKKT